MPQLIPAAARSVLLPAHHRRAEHVTFVERLAEYKPRQVPELPSRAKRSGRRYEHAAQSMLRGFAGYIESPWLRFTDSLGARRMAQPDGLLIEPDCVFVFEIKSTHCIEAYCQLKLLYGPIVQWCYPQHRLVLIEICSEFSPTLRWPEPIVFCDDIVEVLQVHSGLAAVQWRRNDERRYAAE